MELTRSGGHPEYKAEVVELIRSTSKTVGQVARELDLTETAVRQWVRQAELDAGRRWKMLPALVAGNTVVFKPATDTPALGERFVELLIDPESKELVIDANDDLIKGSMITRDGKVVHPSLSQHQAA